MFAHLPMFQPKSDYAIADVIELLKNQATTTTHANDAIRKELHDVKDSLAKVSVNLFGTETTDGLISQTRINARSILELEVRLEASDTKLRAEISGVKATVDKFTWIGLGLALAPTVAVLALWYADTRATKPAPTAVQSTMLTIRRPVKWL